RDRERARPRETSPVPHALGSPFAVRLNDRDPIQFPVNGRVVLIGHRQRLPGAGGLERGRERMSAAVGRFERVRPREERRPASIAELDRPLVTRDRLPEAALRGTVEGGAHLLTVGEGYPVNTQ